MGIYPKVLASSRLALAARIGYDQVKKNDLGV